MAQEPTDQASPDQQPVVSGPVSEPVQVGTLNSVSGVGSESRGAGDGSAPSELDAAAAQGEMNGGLMEGGEPPLSPGEVDELRAHEVAFRWQASEYVHHHKGLGWYAGLGAVALVLGGVAILIKDWMAIGAFAVMMVAILVYARRPPRTLTYELTSEGVTIEGKAYLYGELRSFGVLPDVDWHSIDLVPKKRFVPKISLLFEDADFESIVGHLELHLPRIDQKPDMIDRLSRYLRF